MREVDLQNIIKAKTKLWIRHSRNYIIGVILRIAILQIATAIIMLGVEGVSEK